MSSSIFSKCWKPANEMRNLLELVQKKRDRDQELENVKQVIHQLFQMTSEKRQLELKKMYDSLALHEKKILRDFKKGEKNLQEVEQSFDLKLDLECTLLMQDLFPPSQQASQDQSKSQEPANFFNTSLKYRLELMEKNRPPSSEEPD